MARVGPQRHRKQTSRKDLPVFIYGTTTRLPLGLVSIIRERTKIVRYADTYCLVVL